MEVCLYFLTGKDLLVPACLKESLSVRFCHWSSPLLRGPAARCRDPRSSLVLKLSGLALFSLCACLWERTQKGFRKAAKWQAPTHE